MQFRGRWALPLAVAFGSRGWEPVSEVFEELSVAKMFRIKICDGQPTLSLVILSRDSKAGDV